MGLLGNDFGSIAVIVAVLRQSSESGGGVKTEGTNPSRSQCVRQRVSVASDLIASHGAPYRIFRAELSDGTR